MGLNSCLELILNDPLVVAVVVVYPMVIIVITLQGETPVFPFAFSLFISSSCKSSCSINANLFSVCTLFDPLSTVVLLFACQNEHMTDDLSLAL